ncbi:uncharacterized protein K460DRAFT_381198 [Cucurbitaria berberidis CBS 394.84]|uniref:Uncharacterized protein n=1 Tax=Cucurbitaria berberidis CBS 394.84 TaxID=1168544 RepID=A0A9P4G7F0_9PLEO|nr:uncharacterized protein K460DRAFT_381198 [Cucurbitaria berberidis CBS 394.84]KAF1840389.1 hypothetical protein K460DRAFT_381198 [Cucurbitaria berberidis CBS 394.84]
MATYTLSIVSIVFHGAGADRGNLLQVSLLDRDRLWYQFDRRDGVTILSPNSEGYFQVATIPASQYARAHSIISEEPPPRNGRDRCQDWTMNFDGLVGKSATELAQALGGRWVANRR